MIPILLAIFCLALMLILPIVLTRRAINNTVEIFLKKQALSAENAKTIDELGLTPPSFRQRMFRARDYKPRAMKTLTEAGIIQSTEDGRLYTTVENLARIKTRKG
ncbi:MAG: hypothetical protein PF495_20585 [Spirochaetales bacterium]|nr:hypothetical protein [Spirochaetales bacterium]